MAVVAAIVVVASVPSTIQHFVTFSISYKSGLLSPEDVQALEYLRIASHPGEVVLSTEELLGPISAMTKCHVPVGRYAQYMVPIEDYRRRAADFDSFWTSWHNGQTRSDILRAHAVNYLVVNRQKDLSPRAIAGLTVVYENAEWLIYRVADIGASSAPCRLDSPDQTG